MAIEAMALNYTEDGILEVTNSFLVERETRNFTD